MSQDAPSSRATVFQAADFLADTGSRVTVSSVRHELGGGESKRIRDLLVEWRERRRKLTSAARDADLPEIADDPELEPQDGWSDTDLWPGLPGDPEAEEAKDWPDRVLTVPPGELPVELTDQIDRLREGLAEKWTEVLAGNLSLDDQMSVIRAAAESRVREARGRADAAERELNSLKNELLALRAERDGMAAAIEHKAALETARRARDEAESGPSNDNRTETALAERLEEAEQAHAELEHEVTTLRALLRELRDKARAIGGAIADDIDGQVVTALFREGPAEADAEAIRAALRAAAADRDQLAGDRATLSRDRDQLQRDLSELRARLDSQSHWIDEARTRMTKAGLIRPKKKSGPRARR